MSTHICEKKQCQGCLKEYCDCEKKMWGNGQGVEYLICPFCGNMEIYHMMTAISTLSIEDTEYEHITPAEFLRIWKQNGEVDLTTKPTTMNNTIELRLQKDIEAILHENSYGVSDEYGGTNIGVFNDSFEDVAIEIIKMIKGSYGIAGEKAH